MNSSLVKLAIARVLVSTKRKKREFSLFDVATDLNILKNELGNIKKVSELVGISPGTLNKFLSVFKLPKPILKLIKEKKINSLELAYNLNKLNSEDILELGQYLAENKILTHDLRNLIAYRKQNPSQPIIELLKKIIASKNIKVSVIRISESNFKCSVSEFEERIKKLIGKDNFLTIVNSNSNIDLKITPEGEKALRGVAKSQKLSLQEFINKIIR